MFFLNYLLFAINNKTIDMLLVLLTVRIIKGVLFIMLFWNLETPRFSYPKSKSPKFLEFSQCLQCSFLFYF